MVVSKLGVPFGGPYNEHYSILGIGWGPLMSEMTTWEVYASSSFSRWQNPSQCQLGLAGSSVPDQATPQCVRPGCGQPAFKGQSGEFCSKACRKGPGGSEGFCSPATRKQFDSIVAQLQAKGGSGTPRPDSTSNGKLAGLRPWRVTTRQGLALS